MAATAYTSNDVRSYIALGAQLSGPGTPATTYQFAKWLDGSGSEHDRAVTVEREGGDGQDMNLAYVEHHFADAPVSIYARPDWILRALAWAIGQSSVVATSPVFTHEVMPLPEARLLTYEQFAPGNTIGERLVDSVISELTIHGEVGKPIQITAQVIGGNSPEDRVAASARTVTTEAEPPFMFQQGSYQVALGGAYAADDSLTEWTVTFTRNVDAAVQGVGLGRQVIPPLSRDISVELVRRYQSATQHAAVNYAGGSQAAPTVATGAFKLAVAYGAAGSARLMEIEVPQFAVQGLTRNTFEPDGETVYETLSGMAIKGATHIIRGRIQNMVATHVASGIL